MFWSKKRKQPPKPQLKTFILEPILTPSGLFDGGDETPDLADPVELQDFLPPDDLPDESDPLPDALENTYGQDIPIPESDFEVGVFMVGDSGDVGIDYLFDGGKYKFELAIFSLEGMDIDDFEPGSEEFITEAATRAASDSEWGHIVVTDRTEGAKFSGTLGESNDWNSGDYQGVETVSMRPGDQFGFMLVPNGTVQDVIDNPDVGGSKAPLFSLGTANPDDALHFGQIADVTGDGSTFVMEDVQFGHDWYDEDYNDLIFQVRGATGEAPTMDELIDPADDWRDSDMGQALIEYATPYITPESTADDLDILPQGEVTPEIEAPIVEEKVEASSGESTVIEPLPTETQDSSDFEFASEQQPLVGIIDTGFSGDNPDLDYDKITLGQDHIDGDDNPLLSDGEGNEHGTHVLGVIAAEQDNGIGIDGVNDDAPIWVGRAVGSGRWADSLVEFVDAARESGQPNAMVNLSMDLTQIDADGNVTTRYEFTPMETAALEYARQNNILIAVASGNQAGLMSALGQASMQFDNIITVGAAEQFDPDASNWQGYDRADYSSYGEGLDIMAKGGTQDNPVVGKTGFGSSMATAQVTGAASQVWAANPDISYQQVIQILKQTATDLGETNYDLETGAGLLNVAAAVHLAKTIKADDQTLPLADINPSLTEDDDAIDIDVFPEVVPEEEFQFDDSPINASERAADLWSKTMTLFMGKDWSTEYARAESWIGKITTNRPQYWTKDAQGRPWEILYTTNGFIIRSAGLGAFAFTWEEYKNRNAWGLFWRSVYARRSRSQLLAFKNAYWGQRSWATQTVGSMRRVVGPNGSGWVQEFDGPNGRRLLMLEDGKTEAFWVLGGNYTEYMTMGGLTGMLGFPRSNENKINRADGRYATWQAFSAYGGKSRIHHLSPSPGSVATWGSIGSLYTDLVGAYHWLGMPTRREYHDGDTIFSDFEGGRIAHNRNTGQTEALRPGQQPSWRQVQSKPGFVNGNVGGVPLNFRTSPSTTASSIISKLPQGTSLTILDKVSGGAYYPGNRTDWYKVKVGNQVGYVAAYYVSEGSNNSGGGSGSVTNPLLTRQGISYFTNRPQFYGASGNGYAKYGFGSSVNGTNAYREGNCTWYAFGRLKELGFNPYDVISGHPDASKWGNVLKNGAKVVSNPQPGDVAQWHLNGQNHVAVVEKVEGNYIWISESQAYSNFDGNLPGYEKELGAGTLHRVDKYTKNSAHRYIRLQK